MELLCLLVGLLIPLVALGLALRRGLRPLAAASAYRNVAWKLGLEADTRGVSLQGYLDRRRLYVGEAPRDRRREVRAVLDLQAPLGLGLYVRRRQERLARWRRGRRTLRVGDPSLDDTLEVRAFEPERARALFTDEVLSAVVALMDRAPDVEITDLWVLVHLRRAPPSDKWLLALVEQLRRTARALEAARAALPAPEAMAPWLAPWETLAAELGIAFSPTLPALEGERNGRPVTVHAIRVENGFRADLRVGFRPHRSLGLLVVPEEGPAPSVGQDIEIGDPSFDATFVVKGYDPLVVRRLLGPEARRILRGLRGAARLRVHDVAVELHDAPLDPDVLRHLLGECERLAELLGW